jgi:hypothetical protein
LKNLTPSNLRFITSFVLPSHTTKEPAWAWFSWLHYPPHFSPNRAINMSTLQPCIRTPAFSHKIQTLQPLNAAKACCPSSLFDRYTIVPIQLEFNGGQGSTQGWNGFNEATKTWHRRFLRLYIRVPKLWWRGGEFLRV